MKVDQQNFHCEIWRPRALQSVEFARIQYQNFHFEPHFHDHYVILQVEDGINFGSRCREKYQVMPGELLLIQPGEVHTGSSFKNQPLRYTVFYPEAAVMAKWFEKLEKSPGRIPGFSLKCGNMDLNQFFYDFWKCATRDNFEPLESEIACLEFLQELIKHQSDLPSPPSRPERDSRKFLLARNFIQDRFQDSFSLDDLAAAANTSPFYLIKLFRRHCGLTPFGYLRSYRLERAKKLMRKNRVLTEVAHACGFYDQSHFIRHFKNHTGVLPSRYRRTNV